MERDLPPLKVEISEAQIKERIREMAKEISKDYKGKDLLLVSVLKGSFIFAADLIRELDLEDNEVDFMAISSYNGETESSKNPRIIKDVDTDIRGRNVLIVEDIVDTGYSFETLTRILSARNPASLKTCALLSKPERREVEVPIDYLGFEIPNFWAEGYGLDTNQKGRGHRFIGSRKNP